LLLLGYRPVRREQRSGAEQDEGDPGVYRHRWQQAVGDELAGVPQVTQERQRAYNDHHDCRRPREWSQAGPRYGGQRQPDAGEGHGAIR